MKLRFLALALAVTGVPGLEPVCPSFALPVCKQHGQPDHGHRNRPALLSGRKSSRNTIFILNEGRVGQHYRMG